MPPKQCYTSMPKKAKFAEKEATVAGFLRVSTSETTPVPPSSPAQDVAAKVDESSGGLPT